MYVHDKNLNSRNKIKTTKTFSIIGYLIEIKF